MVSRDVRSEIERAGEVVQMVLLQTVQHLAATNACQLGHVHGKMGWHMRGNIADTQFHIADSLI